MYDIFMNLRKNSFLFAFLLSIIVHMVVFLNTQNASKIKNAELSKVLKVRYLGIENGSKIMTLVDKGQKEKLKLDDLSVEDDFKNMDSVNSKKSAIQKPVRQSKTLQQKVGSQNFSNNNVTVDIDLPEGVKLDDLNEEELKFFSFHKRTLMQYVGTFYGQVRDFEVSNPHLNFPLTNKREFLRGQITFDRNGNIKRIKMLQWSEEEKLQSFFLDVLKKLEKVPNPPEMIIKNNNEFSITYGLIINS